MSIIFKTRPFFVVLMTAFAAASLNIPSVSAGEVVVPLMPAPGSMVNLSLVYTPAHLKGITIHPDNALEFDFLVHHGDGRLSGIQKEQEYRKLIKYFLASLTVADHDQWVNLSPYEKGRIIEDGFGRTEMGRDLLSQDYLLKQITSSLMYPESGLGKAFWNKVYERAHKEYGNTNIPVNTFNKVWIVPDGAAVYESGNTVYILNSHLKVMLDEDYLSTRKHTPPLKTSIPRQIIRKVILPELEREVNEGRNFALLRQIYSGMILASWYKKALKESLLGKAYADKAKVEGVNGNDSLTVKQIYDGYLAAFKKGVYNYIKEDVDQYTQQPIPRKYFAGGFEKNDLNIDRYDNTLRRPGPAMTAPVERDFAQAVIDQAHIKLDVSGRQRAAASDAAMRTDPRDAIISEPYQNMTTMLRVLPGDIKKLVDTISRKHDFPDNIGTVNRQFINIIGRLYKLIELSKTENYHNHFHQMGVEYTSLILNGSAGLIEGPRDLVVTLMGALKHDFHLREAFPGGKEAAASPALVEETRRQLRDLLGIELYPGKAVDDARYTETVREKDKRDARKAFEALVRLVNGGRFSSGLYNGLYFEIEAIICRTDFNSNAGKPASDNYELGAIEIREKLMEKPVDALINGNKPMTRPILEDLITNVKHEFASLKGAIKTDRELAQQDDKIAATKIWIDRQAEIELNFLKSLRKVPEDRLLKIWQLSAYVELADQTGAFWLTNTEIYNEIVDGLQKELKHVNVPGNFPFFFVPQFLTDRRLKLLGVLPVRFKINFLSKMQEYAEISTAHAMKMGSAEAAGLPKEEMFNDMLSSKSRWVSLYRENVMAQLGLYEEGGVIKGMEPKNAGKVGALWKTDLFKSFHVNALHSMVVRGAFEYVNSENRFDVIIRKGEVPSHEGAWMYMIIKGQVLIKTDAGPEYRGPGEHFGELALISGEPRNAEITANVPGTLLLRFRKSTVKGLESAYPPFKRALYHGCPVNFKLNFVTH